MKPPGPRTPSRKVVLASRNSGKLAEMRRVLAAVAPGLAVLGLDDVEWYDEPPETEPTFEGNALLKAHAALAATGLPSLADDSGLCVDALNGMPGVLSARWSGRSAGDAAAADRGTVDRANNELLLAQVRDVPQERRSARFRCAMAFSHRGDDGAMVDEVTCGVMAGRILDETRGEGGFGYDVLFAPDGFERTSAELSPAEKDAISHRGAALRAMAPIIASALLT